MSFNKKFNEGLAVGLCIVVVVLLAVSYFLTLQDLAVEVGKLEEENIELQEEIEEKEGQLYEVLKSELGAVEEIRVLRDQLNQIEARNEREFYEQEVGNTDGQ